MPTHTPALDHVTVLHNSGPGPVATYKTGAVGTTHSIAFQAVLAVLDLEAANRTERMARVSAAKDALTVRGLLHPFRGLVSMQELPGSGHVPALPAVLPWLPGATTHDVHTWLLVAFAHAAPPLLLFTRAPRLTYCTAAHRMVLRWFGAGGQP